MTYPQPDIVSSEIQASEQYSWATCNVVPEVHFIFLMAAAAVSQQRSPRGAAVAL